MTVSGERANTWERNTWPVLEKLAREHPESGIHFQQTRLMVREKDVGSPKAKL
jgi:D-amino-acid oxidase